MDKRKPKKLTSKASTSLEHVEALLYKCMVPGKTYIPKQLHQLLRRVKVHCSTAALKEALRQLVHRQKVKSLSQDRYVREAQYLTGHVDHVNPSYAYIITAHEQHEDVFVKQGDLQGALHKDLVKIVVLPHTGYGKRPVGKVVHIIARNPSPIVGRLEQRGEHTFVIPEGRRMHYDILVKDPADVQAQPNDKVVVVVVDWPNGVPHPVGRIQQVLGPSGVHEVEMHAIMAEFGLTTHFSEAVEKEVEAISATLPMQEIDQRKDFRAVPTFTIDPEDAKDFDDAISLRKLPQGRYEVGIHIADVSYYVHEGGHLDQEALERGTSVYLVDRTISMLPERLSNDLCSLIPHKDRFAFSIVLELDHQGNVHQEWIGTTIIHSQKRFTYEEAQRTLTQQEGAFCKELTALHALAQKLREARFQRGSIRFSATEVKFELDTNGKPLRIIPKVGGATHHLVEEFMILANARVATRVSKMEKQKHHPTFVYRTHDQPDKDKLVDFWGFVRQLGYGKATPGQPVAHALNDVLDTTKDAPEANIIHALAVRTMAKALYTHEDMSHFGLALKHYTHFTSPIRRYPDIMVHRLLKQYLKKPLRVDPKPYKAKCQHASERERVAAEAERASIRYKQVEWMQQWQGSVLEGMISGVTDWGIYVELVENKCEGMVRLADMTDDYYTLDEKGFKVIGKRSQKVYRLGDHVSVRIASCDLTKRTVTLHLVSEKTDAAKTKITAR